MAGNLTDAYLEAEIMKRRLWLIISLKEKNVGEHLNAQVLATTLYIDCHVRVSEDIGRLLQARLQSYTVQMKVRYIAQQNT